MLYYIPRLSPFHLIVHGDVFPGLKPMGCSVFALRAMQSVQTRGALLATPRMVGASADWFTNPLDRL